MVEPHIFCGPDFVLEVPRVQAEAVLVRQGQEPQQPPSAEGGQEASPSTATGSSGWAVSEESLLQFQSELYGVCTPGLRRRLHKPVLSAAAGQRAIAAGDIKEVAKMLMYTAADAPSSTVGGSLAQRRGGTAPPAPEELQFLASKVTSTLTKDEEASLNQSLKVIAETAKTEVAALVTSSVFVPIVVKDSRMAGELYLLCLRNASIALSGGCRLHNYYRATARAAAIDPADILRRKEAQRARYNLDSDLWSALEVAVTPDLLEDVLARKKKMDEESGRYPAGRLLNPREEHQQKIEAILLYCESKVSYGGVFDIKEEASPLLIAMGLFFRLQLTLTDLYTHFVRHARRAIRALALLIARYTVAPEELAPFFYPSLHDGVVIATSEDGLVTCPMSTFATTALTKDEVSEAWLPVYHPYYLETVISPAMEGMAWLWQRQLEAREQRRTGQTARHQDGEGAPSGSPTTGTAATAGAEEEEEDDGVPLTKARARAAAGTEDEPTMNDEMKGSGRGVAALGFASLRELNDYAKQQERSLLPQRMTTLLASRYSRRRERDDALAALNEDDSEGRAEDDGVDVEYSGSDAASNSSEEEFLIHVDVAGGGCGKEGPGSLLDARRRSSRKGKDSSSGANAQAKDGGPRDASGELGGARKMRRKEERLDPHAAILKEGYRVVLALLGRRQPFNRHDERYLEF